MESYFISMENLLMTATPTATILVRPLRNTLHAAPLSALAASPVSLWNREPFPLKSLETASAGFWPGHLQDPHPSTFTGLTSVWWVFLHVCLCGGGAHTCMCTWRPEVDLTCPSSGLFFLSERQHLPLAWNLQIRPVLSDHRLSPGARICCMPASSVHTPTPSLGVRLWGRECSLYATLRFSVHQQGLPLLSFSVHCLASPSRTFFLCLLG